MLNKMRNLVVAEEGQGMTEYGLVLGVIAVGVVGTLVLLKDEIGKMFSNALTKISGANAELNKDMVTTP